MADTLEWAQGALEGLGMQTDLTSLECVTQLQQACKDEWNKWRRANHPDKPGGSNERFQEGNETRKQLSVFLEKQLEKLREDRALDAVKLRAMQKRMQKAEEERRKREEEAAAIEEEQRQQRRKQRQQVLKLIVGGIKFSMGVWHDHEFTTRMAATLDRWHTWTQEARKRKLRKQLQELTDEKIDLQHQLKQEQLNNRLLKQEQKTMHQFKEQVLRGLSKRMENNKKEPGWLWGLWPRPAETSSLSEVHFMIERALDNVTQSSQELSAKCSSLEKSAERMRSEMRRMEEETAAWIRHCRDAEAEADELRNANAGARSQLDLQHDRVQGLETDNQKMLAWIQELETERNLLANKVTNFSWKNQDLGKNLQNLCAQRAEQLDKGREQERSIKQLNDRLAASENRIRFEIAQELETCIQVVQELRSCDRVEREAEPCKSAPSDCGIVDKRPPRHVQCEVEVTASEGVCPASAKAEPWASSLRKSAAGEPAVHPITSSEPPVASLVGGLQAAVFSWNEQRRGLRPGLRMLHLMQKLNCSVAEWARTAGEDICAEEAVLDSSTPLPRTISECPAPHGEESVAQAHAEHGTVEASKAEHHEGDQHFESAEEC